MSISIRKVLTTYAALGHINEFEKNICNYEDDEEGIMMEIRWMITVRVITRRIL